MNVLSAAVEAGVRRVLNTSTGGALYGDAQEDVAAANLAAAEVSQLPRSEYNIGTGIEVTLLELAAAVAAAVEIATEAFAPGFEAERAGEVRRSCLDVTAAPRDLALPAPSSLVDGLRRTLAWMAHT